MDIRPAALDSHRARRFIALALLSTALPFAALAQAPPPVPAKAGEAAGTVTIGKETVTLKYAYALKPAKEDDGYSVILTDQPVAAEALAKELAAFGGKPLLRGGKISGVSMLVSVRGNTLNVIPFVGEGRGSHSQGGGSLDKFAASAAGVTGQGHKDPGGPWSYSASFNAAFAKP